MTRQVCQTQSITNLPDLEESRRVGLLSLWEELMAADTTATFYQGPAWCMEWYRSYADCFRPLVLLMRCDDALVGIVPLAVENATKRLVFATDNMADYRDVVALPTYRRSVVAEMLRIYESGSFPNALGLGPTQHESETVAIIGELTAGKSELRTITRAHPCWRFGFSEPTATVKVGAKESVRRHLNYYKRQGPVSLERIPNADRWDSIKDEFFDQHSLRQLAVGRPVSFNDTRKRAFYDALIKHHQKSVHITVVRAGGRFIAGHYGYVWRGMLYWGASAFDVREAKHSPGQVLIGLLLSSASASELSAVDFTLGTEDFKLRFGNYCVSLPTVEIYARSQPYLIRKLRDHFVTGAKALVTRSVGAQNWGLVTRLGKYLGSEAQELREPGLKVGLTQLIHRGLASFSRKKKEIVFIATPEEVHPSEFSLAPGEICSFGTNKIKDLLKCDEASRETEGEIAAAVKATSGLYQSGRALHTILLNDRLAAWGWSHQTEEHTLIELPGFGQAEVEAIVISGTYVRPEYRQRQLEKALVSHILKDRFAGVARHACIICGESNAALREAVEDAGFRPISVNLSRRT